MDHPSGRSRLPTNLSQLIQIGERARVSKRRKDCYRCLLSTSVIVPANRWIPLIIPSPLEGNAHSSRGITPFQPTRRLIVRSIRIYGIGSKKSRVQQDRRRSRKEGHGHRQDRAGAQKRKEKSLKWRISVSSSRLTEQLDSARNPRSTWRKSFQQSTRGSTKQADIAIHA